MPIYEYHCGKCGDFEVMQKMSDKPLTTCPTCRRKVNKLISSTSFQLKGSGWYVTDYARKGGSGASDTKAGSGTKSDDKADKSSDGSGDKSDTSSDKSVKSEDTKTETKSSDTVAKPKKGSSEKAAAA
jgi:putative FmdB family regulatory protein